MMSVCLYLGSREYCPLQVIILIQLKIVESNENKKLLQALVQLITSVREIIKLKVVNL